MNRARLVQDTCLRKQTLSVVVLAWELIKAVMKYYLNAGKNQLWTVKKAAIKTLKAFYGQMQVGTPAFGQKP